MRNKIKILMGVIALVAGIGASAAFPAGVAQAHGGTYWGRHSGVAVPGGSFYCTGSVIPDAPSGANGDYCSYGHDHNGNTCRVYTNAWRWNGTVIGGNFVGSYVC